LRLRSAPGRGSVVRFPVRVGDPGGILTSLSGTVVTGPSAQGRHVLCIDDDPSILEGLTRLLGRWGCIVRGARDETLALQALSEGFVPDAVLCDFQLANHRTGAQALTAVREALRRSGHEGAVMLLITGDMASGELATLAAQGIPVLHKPVTPARLRRTLEILWQQAERDGAAGNLATASCPLPASR
jgi:CheY-like chemotaxis protein